MRLSILGFGLVGGSLARALRRREPGRWTIAAWSPTGQGPGAAFADGIVDRVAEGPASAVGGADLIVLAAPPLACLELLDELGGPLRAHLGPDALITDVASTKRRIVARAAERGLPFAGGHPMAGRETTGYGAADADLFVDRPWVVCSSADDDAARVERLADAVGARPVRMDPVEHDRAVAAISHLPLVLSAALVEAVAGGDGSPTESWPAARALAASGWRDMTRLARGDPAMGAGMAATNADLIGARLTDLRAVLDGWLADLAAPETEAAARVHARLLDARARLEGKAGR